MYSVSVASNLLRLTCSLPHTHTQRRYVVVIALEPPALDATPHHLHTREMRMHDEGGQRDGALLVRARDAALLVWARDWPALLVWAPTRPLQPLGFRNALGFRV